MKSKKIMAATLAATMVVGSSMTVFAEDPAGVNSATGEGTTFEHVNKDITSVSLPTQAAVTDVFDYYVDPEGLIDDAGTLADGNTTVEGNADGVYFKNKVTSSGTEAVDASVTSYSIGSVTTGYTITIPTNTTAAKLVYKDEIADSSEGVTTSGGYEEAADGSDYTGKSPVTVTIVQDSDSTTVTATSGDEIVVSPYQAATSGSTTTSYSSSSDAVSFEGRNSVAVDVSVTAAVAATTGGKDIALVADADALAAATTPALLMKLKVGANERAITADGATASATIAGVPDNFAVKADNNKFVYDIRTNTDPDNGGTALDPWSSTTVQLVGKTNTADVPGGVGAMTAPQITLTWQVAKHTDAPQEPEEPELYVSAASVSATNKVLTLTMPSGVSVTKVELIQGETVTTLASGNHYTVSGDKLNIAKYAAGWVGRTIKITYSDSHEDTLTCQ